MAVTGVNRIMIAVRDLEAAKKLYGDLLGATFVDAHWTGEPFGIAVSIAWDAGIELCAPLPGREDSSAVSGFLATRGEGVMSVFFNVTDGEVAIERAIQHGYNSLHSLDYTQADIDQHLPDRGVRPAQAGEACGQAVKRGADLIQVEHLLDRGGQHARTAMFLDLDQPVIRQRAQGPAHD